MSHEHQQAKLALLLVVATTALALVAADYAQPQQQQQDAYSQQPANYEHQSSGSKAKKIQIVYIKVPLAKLKPSLANEYNAAEANSSSAAYKSDASK